GQSWDAQEKLADSTEISQDRKSGIITIRVTDHVPQRAADLTRAYVDQLNWLLVEVNTSSAHRERIFLEERLNIVKKELDSATKQLSEFSVKNTTIDPKEQGHAMVQAAVSLQGELIATQTELRGLQQIYTDNNVRVRSLRARIAELRDQINKLRGPDPNLPEEAGSDSDSLYPSFRKLPTLGVSYADLYREVKLRETVFEVLTQQYEMAKVEEAKEIPTAKVLDPADVPEKKSGPPRTLILIFGVFLSFAAGAALVIGKAAWEQTGADDPRKKFIGEIWADTQPTYSRIQKQAQQLSDKFRHNSNGNYR
ncbi:MAG TPA: GNVR domain-containing protein, partial [Terriglobales bacterium]|nr:GNVR domain-containing protein [Terriglobales bacterium]